MAQEDQAATQNAEGEVPMGQKLFDNPFILLVAGIVIMLVFYTGWGIWEIMNVPQAPLP